MDKETLWKRYVERYPSFEGDKNITITPAGLKKLFEGTYNIAFDEGDTVGYNRGLRVADNLKKAQNNPSYSGNSSDVFKNVFGTDIFGKKQ